MTRINNITREKISTVLLKHRFKPQSELLVTQSEALFDEVYNAIYDIETRKLMSKLLKLHSKAFPFFSCANCTANGYNITVGNYGIGWRHIKFNSELKLKPYFHGGLDHFKFNHCETAENLVNFATDCKNFTDQINTASHELKSALSQINTVKQLRSGWPEVLPLIEHLLPAPDQIVNLPTIQLSALNLAYGLPVEVGET